MNPNRLIRINFKLNGFYMCGDLVEFNGYQNKTMNRLMTNSIDNCSIRIAEEINFTITFLAFSF